MFWSGHNTHLHFLSSTPALLNSLRVPAKGLPHHGCGWCEPYTLRAVQLALWNVSEHTWMENICPPVIPLSVELLKNMGSSWELTQNCENLSLPIMYYALKLASIELSKIKSYWHLIKRVGNYLDLSWLELAASCKKYLWINYSQIDGEKVSNLFDEYCSAGYWANQIMKKKH